MHSAAVKEIKKKCALSMSGDDSEMRYHISWSDLGRSVKFKVVRVGV